MGEKSKFEWKMVQVDGDQMVKVLQEFTDDDYEIFTIQYTGSKWCIVARKFKKENSGRNTIGFGRK